MEDRNEVAAAGGGPTLDVVVPAVRVGAAVLVASTLLPVTVAVGVAAVGVALAAASGLLERLLGPTGRVGALLSRVADVGHVAAAGIALTASGHLSWLVAGLCAAAAVAVAGRPLASPGRVVPRATVRLGGAADVTLLLAAVALLAAGGHTAVAAAARPLAWALVWWGVGLAVLTVIVSPFRAPSHLLPARRPDEGAR